MLVFMETGQYFDNCF